MMIDPRLPGASLIEQGLHDLRGELRTPAACLVASGRTRLRRLGLDVPPADYLVGFPEHALYDVLTDQLGQRAGYARYKAMLAQLHSFANAAALLGNAADGSRVEPPLRSH